MIDDLFEFPTVMVDGDNEERKQSETDRLGIGEDKKEYDIVYGTAEYPYYEFFGIEDRWLPTKESFENALVGKFDACVVKFSGISPLLVPWSKGKFKKAIRKFKEEREKVKSGEGDGYQDMTVMKITTEQLAKIFGAKIEGDDKQGEKGPDPE